MFNRIRFPLLLLVIAVGMTWVFWWPLYGGAGFIGGDLYPYFFPQKAFLADRLKQGEFPLWNDLTGFGYPVLGESQTGAAYPFHLLFYWLLDLNTAYNAEHLLHYVICFVASGLFARRLGLSSVGAILSALVFTYGWFPPRACLEWAILTGAWMPVALWCTECFFQTRWWRYAIGLSLALGLQMLAGHFHLAFITQLLCASYALMRLWIERHQNGAVHPGTAPPPMTASRRGFNAATALLLAGLAGFGLAAVQVLPTWELKQRSSRVVSGGDYDPAYGHMPPLYTTQLIAPWCWYSLQAIDEDNLVRDVAEFAAPWHWFGPQHDLDQVIQQSRFLALTNGTNKVEAHVYAGLIPLFLAGLAVVTRFRSKRFGRKPNPETTLMDTMTIFWLVAGILALSYSTGLLLPVGLRLPGFRFFRGPGRYGIVTTLAIALLAGQMVTRWRYSFSSRTALIAVMTVVFCSTCGDLWLVSRMVKYSYLVAQPAIRFRHQSLVRERLLKEPAFPRLLAPGPNVGNLLGVSCVPWYLGISPEEYVDPQFAMPPVPKAVAAGKPTPGSPDLLKWLSRSGVTHILNFEPLEESSWNVELVWRGIDPFLNRVWGRAEPIYLYRFHSDSLNDNEPSFPGRAYTSDGRADLVPHEWIATKPEIRHVKVAPAESGQRKLILTELAYPGWMVQRDGQPWESSTTGLFRVVECPAEGGEFTWTYRPASVFYGALISAITAFSLAAIGHVRFWHYRPKPAARNTE